MTSGERFRPASVLFVDRIHERPTAYRKIGKGNQQQPRISCDQRSRGWMGWSVSGVMSRLTVDSCSTETEKIIYRCGSKGGGGTVALTRERFALPFVRRWDHHARHPAHPSAAQPLDRKFHTDSHGLRIGDRQQHTWPVVVIEMMKERVVDQIHAVRKLPQVPQPSPFHASCNEARPRQGHEEENRHQPELQQSVANRIAKNCIPINKTSADKHRAAPGESGGVLGQPWHTIAEPRIRYDREHASRQNRVEASIRSFVDVLPRRMPYQHSIAAPCPLPQTQGDEHRGLIPPVHLFSNEPPVQKEKQQVVMFFDRERPQYSEPLPAGFPNPECSSNSRSRETQKPVTHNFHGCTQFLLLPGWRRESRSNSTAEKCAAPAAGRSSSARSCPSCGPHRATGS